MLLVYGCFVGQSLNAAIRGEQKGGEAELVGAEEAGVGFAEALDHLGAGMAESVVTAYADDRFLGLCGGQELGV